MTVYQWRTASAKLASPLIAGTNHQVEPSLFEGFGVKESGDFKLLGVAFGSGDFFTHLTRRRCEKAKHVLRQISTMTDPQTAGYPK